MKRVIDTIGRQYHRIENYGEKIWGGGIPPQIYFRFAADCIRYRINATDYFELSFYNKSNKEKKEYIGTWEQAQFAHLVNSEEQGIEFTKKTKQYKLFHHMLKREFLFTEDMNFDEFEAFVCRHREFLFKPDYSDCGRGIKKIKFKEENIDSLFKELKKQKGVLDELVLQHHLMRQLNSDSLNTIRVVSLCMDNQVEIAAAALRMGRKGVIIDNYSAGGIVASVDINSGTVIADGEDMFGKRYHSHPDSGIQFEGFQVPNWDKVIATVKEAQRISPIQYVGWDIGIRENDCVIIEGNYNPMLNVVQIAGAGGLKRKMKAYEQKFIKNND